MLSYSLEKIFRSRSKSTAVKIRINKTIVNPVLVYESETWLMTNINMRKVSTWERKNINKDMFTSGRTRIMENKM